MKKLFVTFEDGTCYDSIVLAEDPDVIWSIWLETADPLYSEIHGEVVEAYARPLFGSERMEITSAVRSRLI